ncbi:protein shisa-5 [Alligator mississippiensis]|uniref:Protein shisa-5 n=1 Tax=Alligator mississippiensis TaxID=8496 RepID=A0A151PBP4_ALLMI|nr:protein shisa-5 [Alligator mississippiensis]KYO46400.1 protein shisa-5 [Alligator mississippiensis]
MGFVGGAGFVALGTLLLQPPGVLSEVCKAYADSGGRTYPVISCPAFCCGNCLSQYCCSDESHKFDEDEQLECNGQHERTYSSIEENTLVFSLDSEWDHERSFTTSVAVGITIFAVFVVTIILCFTCSCCCLYKICRRPRPVVTTTTATTVIHAPYPQQPGISPGYPAVPYQGYHPVPIQPQPGMPAAPYPTQYPPPYPTQPSGPPAYHETVAAGAGAPYPVSQPPYNPAYVDLQKPTY